MQYRSGRPSWNVKRYNGPTAEECAQVARDYGTLPPDAVARPGTASGDALPWGPAWIEAFADRSPEAYYLDLGDASSSEFEHVREYALDLFGPRANVYRAGRSGGWVELHCPTVTRDEVESAESIVRDPTGTETYERDDARELLERLDTFGRYVADEVEGHGAEQAFALFQSFERYAAELSEERAEAEAAARLDRARTAFEDAATALRDAATEVALHGSTSPKPFGFTVDDLVPAVARFNAARAELRAAKGGAS